MTPRNLTILGSIVSAIFAGLAFAYPSEAPVLANVSGIIFGALHIPRPGDVKASP